LIEQQNLEKAMQIYYFLLKEGELGLENNKELYIAYSDNEVRAIVEILARESDVTIEKYAQVIYILPGEDNDVLGIKASEMQRIVGSDTRKVDLYLSQYIVTLIISEFFKGKGNIIKSRDFMRISEVVEDITERLKFAASKAYIEKEEEEASFNVVSIYEQWSALPTDDPASKMRKTKFGYVRSVASFLEKQGLLQYDVLEEDIRPANKLTHLMSYNFLNKDRKDRIDRLFSEEENNY
jgi:hypothetical protein